MSDKVILHGWDVNWCQKRIAGVLTQNVNPPKYTSDPAYTFQIIYDETIDYGLFFKISRNDYSVRPYIKAELKVNGIKDPIFFTNVFNEQYIDPQRAHVEIPCGPNDMELSGKLYWPSKNREFHKPGLHTLIVSLGTKKYGELSGNPPVWNSTVQHIPIDIRGVIPDQ